MNESPKENSGKGISFFERYLTVWVVLSIGVGVVLGKLAPGVAKALDGLAVYVADAPVVSIPIAVCLFFMMYPIMVKIDFQEVLKAGRSARPVGLTLVLALVWIGLDLATGGLFLAPLPEPKGTSKKPAF